MKKFLFVLGFLAVFFLPLSVRAQTSVTGAVTGSVKDKTGGVIPGAEVELTNLATNTVLNQITNDSGNYTFSSVPPGNYRLTVKMPGFRTAVASNITVQVAKSLTVNMSMEVGAVEQTVEVIAGAQVELQKTDATVGNVITGDPMLKLPSLQRNAVEFLTLQPATIPEAGNGDFGNSGGAVSGARSDQNTFTLDGIDVTDNSVAGGAGFRTIVPVPVDSVQEFRVGVTNPNATFGRSSGAQVALVGRRGTNTYHGAVYWYHQNDNLNANSWTNNRNGIPKAELKDNRFGFRLGGPIFKDKTFFFGMFEGRNFPRSFDTLRTVPSDTLRQGIVRFRDAAGNIVNYNLASSTLCGPNNDMPCDPRGLGLNPSISELWSLMPKGNDPSQGDGLNTIGLRGTASAPQKTRYGVFRFDHNFTDLWRFSGSGTYFRNLQTLGGGNAARAQLDIRGSEPVFTGIGPQRGQNITLGLTGTPTPTLTNSFHFGWTRDRTGTQRIDPSAVANLLAINGTDTSAGHIALNVGGRASFDSLVSEPIDVGTQRGRTQGNDNQTYQFVDDVTWLKGNHTLQFGANIRHILTMHNRNDKVIGSLSSLVASVDDGNFISIPDTARPPTCGSGVTTNCLAPGDVTQWNRLFAGATGMVDNISILIARDGSLNPLPFGTPLIADTTQNNYEFYFQDIWQLRPSLTVTLGLSYGWLTPPSEVLGRQTLITNNETGEVVTFKNYIEPKRQAALDGTTYNPELSYTPINDLNRDGIFNIDRNNWAPRLAAAWNPDFSSGPLATIFGSRKTVVRGGFSIVYDRINTVQSVIIPMLGVGFGQTVNVAGPDCNATGSGGVGCTPGGNDPSSAFRVGVDGTLPLPDVGQAQSPVVPGTFFSELLSFQMDPDFKVGKSYSLDFSIQRELAGNMLMEIGYVGRFGRDLPTSTNLNSSPFFQKDPVSGQTFAQAFDAIADQLRAGVPSADVTPQPFFDNQMPGGTAGIVGGSESNFIDGDVTSIFQNMDITRSLNGLTPFNNLQVLDNFLRTSIGRSNYSAMFVTLRKPLSHGLAFDMNYTFSKSLDQNGLVQNAANFLPNSFVPDFEYGPSAFDRTHVFNANFLYNLPAGRGHMFDTGNWFSKVLSDWYVSGVFRAASGLPLIVSQGVPALGGGALLPSASAAIPTVDPGTFGHSVHDNVAGTNGVGTNGDPATGGSGLNQFANPELAIKAFRKIRLSEDGRSGRGNPLRGFPSWDFDMSIGKTTHVSEQIGIRFSFDFFNVFNHVNFASPTLNLTQPRSFGVVTTQNQPTRRQSDSRWIQFGMRVEF